MIRVKKTCDDKGCKDNIYHRYWCLVECPKGRKLQKDIADKLFKQEVTP
jgi:hypothetical protein